MAEENETDWEQRAREIFPAPASVPLAPPPSGYRPFPESEAPSRVNQFELDRAMDSMGNWTDRNRQTGLLRWTTGDPNYRDQAEVRQASEEEAKSALSFESIFHIFEPFLLPQKLVAGTYRDVSAKMMKDPDDPGYEEARERYAERRGRTLLRQTRDATFQQQMWNTIRGATSGKAPWRGGSIIRNARNSLKERYGEPIRQGDLPISQVARAFLPTSRDFEEFGPGGYDRRLAAMAIQEEYGQNIFELGEKERRELIDRIQEERPDIALVWDPQSRRPPSLPIGPPSPARALAALRRTRTTVDAPPAEDMIGSSSHLWDESSDETRERYRELGRKWYDALQSGAYRDKQHIATFGPDFRIYGADRDILEAAISQSEALEMSVTAENPFERMFWADLSTPSGRATYDVLSTIALDPLWFAGAGGGARTVTVAGKTVTTTRSMNRVLGRLETASRLGGNPALAVNLDDLIRHFYFLEHGSEAESAAAHTRILELIDNVEGASKASAGQADEITALLNGTSDDIAETIKTLKARRVDATDSLRESTEALGRANRGELVAGEVVPSVRDIVRVEAHKNYLDRFITSIETRTGDWRKIATNWRDNAASLSRSSQAAADHAGAMLEQVAQGKHLAGIRVAPGTGRLRNGVLKAHVPFMENTYHLNLGGGASKLVEAGAGVVPERGRAVATRIIGATTDAIENIKLPNLHRIVGEATGLTAEEVAKLGGKAYGATMKEHLTNGQYLAAVMHQSKRKVGDLSYYYYDAVARAIGTRFMQPYLSSLQSAAHAEILGSTAAAQRVVSDFPSWAGGFLGGGVAGGLALTAGASLFGAGVAIGVGGLMGRAAAPGRAAIRVMRLQEAAWQKYQTAMGRYLQIVNIREAKIARAIHRLYKVDAPKALKNLKARKAAEQAVLLKQKAELLRRLSREQYLSRYRSLEDTIYGNDRILSESYGIQDVMNEVNSARERGAGSLNPNSPFYLGDEFAGHAARLRKLLDDFAEEAGIPKQEAEEALLQLSQLDKGDYEKYQAVLEEIEELLRKRESGVLASERKAAEIRAVFREEVHKARMFVELFSDFADNPTKQKAFIDALESLRVSILDEPAGLAANRMWVRQTLARKFNEVLPGEGGVLADRVIWYAKEMFFEKDAELAVRRLAVELSEANVRASRVAQPGGVTLMKPSGFRTKLPKNIDDWVWVPLEPADYSPEAMLLINRARKQAGKKPIGTWDKAKKQWEVRARLPGDGQITADAIRAALKTRQSELQEIKKFIKDQWDSIVADGMEPTAQELARVQRNIDRMAQENRRKAYALIGRRMWPHFEEWRSTGYPKPPNVRHSDPETALARAKVELLEAAGDEERVTALIDKVQVLSQQRAEMLAANEPWLLGEEEFISFLEQWSPPRGLIPDGPTGNLPFYSKPSFLEHRLAERFVLGEYTEENVLACAERMLRYYDEKYGIGEYRLIYERLGQERYSNAGGWHNRSGRRIAITEKAMRNGQFLTVLRHEIEHAIDYALRPSFRSKPVTPWFTGIGTAGVGGGLFPAEWASEGFVKRYIVGKDKTITDVITDQFKGHHSEYSSFERDYVRRELVRDAMEQGRAVDPKVLKEVGIDPTDFSPLTNVYRQAYEFLWRADMWEGTNFATKNARLPSVSDAYRRPSGHVATFYDSLLEFAGEVGMEDPAIRAIIDLYDHVAVATSRSDADAAYDWWLRLAKIAPDEFVGADGSFGTLVELLPRLHRMTQEVGAARAPQRMKTIQQQFARMEAVMPKGTTLGDLFKNYLIQLAKTKAGGPNNPARAVIGRLLKHIDVSDVPPIAIPPTIKTYFDNMLGGLSPNVRSAQLEEMALDLKLLRQDRAKGVREEIEQIPYGGGVGYFTSDTILQERLLTAVEDAKNSHEATLRVRTVLHGIFKAHGGSRAYPHINKSIDKMAKRIGPALWNASKDDVFQVLEKERGAIEQIVRRTKEEMDKTRASRKSAALGANESERDAILKGFDERIAAQEAEAAAQRPQFDPPLSLNKPPKDWLPEDYIDVEKWQSDLVKKANQEMENWGITSEREKLLLILTLFKDRPEIPKDMGDMYAYLASKFPRVHGNRMGDIDPELYPLVESLGAIIGHFEKMMLSQGKAFIADQEHLIRTFGVVNYVPHLMAPGAITDAMTAREVAQKYSAMYEAMPYESNRAAALESRFAMRLNNEQRRKLYGTMAEINAGKAGAFQADPLSLMGHYLRVSNAMAADELMTALLHNGTIRPVQGRPGVGGMPGSSPAVVANEQDLVPLFQRGVPGASDRAQRIMFMIDDDILFTGDYAQVRAMWERIAQVEGELDAAIVAEVRQHYKVTMDNDGPLAVWLRDVAELKRMQATEEVILDIRAKQYDEGLDLYDPRPRIAAIQDELNGLMRVGDDAAKEAADAKKALADAIAAGADSTAIQELRRSADALEATYLSRRTAFDAGSSRAYEQFIELADEINQLHFDVIGKDVGTKYKVTPSGLRDIYVTNAESWKLYLPRVVHQSMKDLLEVGEMTGWGGQLKRMVDKFQAFYKIRLTVVAAAFTARNFLSNNMSNLLDLGPFGALNPVTNMQALQLASAIIPYENYGSLNKARAALHAPQGAGEADALYKVRVAKAKTFEISFGGMLDEGVDLGDGIIMHPDDAIARLKNENVLSETFTQFVDIDIIERQILDTLKDPKKGKSSAVTNLLSDVEDLAYVILPAVGGAPLVAMPKKFGATVARTVENQGRLCNFIGNMKRGGNWSQSAQHVNKFLFDYNDLTAIQRTWLRTIFPFFTWNIKNMHLQMEMMTKNPVFYAQFRRVLLDTIPRALRSDEDPYSVAWYVTSPRYQWSRVRVPVPGTSNAYLSGFGTPQEAFVEWGGPFFTLLNTDNWRNSLRHQDNDAVFRFVGHINFAARIAAEFVANKKSFQNQPIGAMTNGRAVYELMETLQLMGLHPIAEVIREFTDLHITTRTDPRTGRISDYPIVSGGFNNAIASSPWSRTVQDMAKMGTAYSTALALDMYGPEAGFSTEDDLGKWWRYLDSYSGLKVRYYDQHAAYRGWAYRKEQQWMDETIQRGIGSTFTRHFWNPQ